MKNRKCTSILLNIDSALFCVFFLFIGVMMIIAGINKLYYYVDLQLVGTETDGVIEHPATTTILGGRPLVRYEDAVGIIHEFRSKAKTHWFSKPRKGETLSVIYDKQESQRMIVNDLLYYVLLPLGFIAAGCFFSFQAVCQRNRYSLHPSTPVSSEPT